MDEKLNPVQEGGSDRYHVPNLARALHVLELLAAAADLTIGEISSRLSIPRNSAFRIVTTLRDHGYLDRDQSKQTYRLSRKLLALGHSVVEQEGLLAKSIDVLADLRDESGETALIAALISDGGIVLEQAIAAQPVKVSVQIGCRFPLHTAAPAKVILAHLPARYRDRLLKTCHFEKLTDKTITSREALLEQLQTVKQNGYAVDRGEEVDGVHCVAAAVFDYRSQPVASIWVTAPAQRLPEERFETIAELVKRHAVRISRRLGYSDLVAAS
jgi:DNA-binding IclR family transcriptional regulator